MEGLLMAMIRLDLPSLLFDNWIENELNGRVRWSSDPEFPQSQKERSLDTQ